MELNLNSLHARIFRWVLFVSKDRMPKSLCPYFWQSVLMWLFIVPLLAMGLPVRFLKIIILRENPRYLSFSSASANSVIIYGGLFIGYAMSFFMYCLFANVTKEYLDTNELLIVIGGTSWFISIAIGLVAIIASAKDYYDRKKWEKYGFNKPEKKNVIVESVKGIYNKYCPRIDWKDQK